MAIDHMVYNPLEPEPVGPPTPFVKREDTLRASQTLVERVTSVEKDGDAYYTPAEKLREAYRPRFVSPRLSARLLARRLRRQIGMTWDSFWTKPPAPPNERHEALRRMARTRKQVTVLGRLLATKADVVSQIRKRLAKTGQSSTSDEQEVAIYMGDVEGACLLLEDVNARRLTFLPVDHILTLQTALAHYERLLSQSHPQYLAKLRSESEGAKGSIDMNILYLSTVSIGALVVGPLIGACFLLVLMLRSD